MHSNETELLNLAVGLEAAASTERSPPVLDKHQGVLYCTRSLLYSSVQQTSAPFTTPCRTPVRPPSPTYAGTPTGLLFMQQVHTTRTLHACCCCRCNQPCVAKWFKSGLAFEETFFSKDLQAVGKAQDLIDAFNALQLCNIIHLNHPEVWTFRRGTR